MSSSHCLAIFNFFLKKIKIFKNDKVMISYILEREYVKLMGVNAVDVYPNNKSTWTHLFIIDEIYRQKHS